MNVIANAPHAEAAATTSSQGSVAVSVVVPSRDRPEMLDRCLRSLLGQRTAKTFEAIVVDDGSYSAIRVPRDPRIRIVAGPRRGPAAARNVGIRAAKAPIILFTDDDTIVSEGWIEAASGALDHRPDAVGVEGPVTCPGFDRLFEHAVSSSSPGAFMTCNVGYRRSALRDEGGFDERFRFADGEDVDLARRMTRRGPVLFVEDMRVAHPPRPVRAAEAIRRGKHVESEWVFHLKYPETRSPKVPMRWGPLIGILRRWRHLLVTQRVGAGGMKREARALGLASGEFGVALWVTLTRWKAFKLEMQSVSLREPRADGSALTTIAKRRV